MGVVHYCATTLDGKSKMTPHPKWLSGDHRANTASSPLPSIPGKGCYMKRPSSDSEPSRAFDATHSPLWHAYHQLTTTSPRFVMETQVTFVMCHLDACKQLNSCFHSPQLF